MKGRGKTQKADSRGGGFLLLPHCLMASEAFRTASPRAIKVLLALCLKHDGFNNGSISLGFRELAGAVDSGNNVANSKALCQLMERGLVALGRSYPKGQRLANEYRLTFMPTGDAPATNDYLGWTQGDAGTAAGRGEPGNFGNFRASITETRTAFRVEDTETGEETSRFDSLNGVDAKPPFSRADPVSIASTHIGLPSVGLASSAQISPLNGGRPQTAAPDAADLRDRVQRAIDAAEHGAQGQLAALASIRPAALSKFLHNSGSLNDQSRIRLTMALPKLATRIPERMTA